MAPIIGDKEIAASVIEAIKAETRALQVETGVTPGPAVVLVGDDPASRTYVAAKSRMAKECGFTSIQHTLAADTKQDELSELVASLNADSSVHGGSGANRSSGLHVVNAGKLATGDLETGRISCTPAGALALLRRVHGYDLSGLHAIIVGRSSLTSSGRR